MALHLESLLESGVAWRVVSAPKSELPRPTHSRGLSKTQTLIGACLAAVASVASLRLGCVEAMVVLGWGYLLLRPRPLPIATAFTDEGIAVGVAYSDVLVPWEQVEAQGELEVEWGLVRLVVVRTKTKFAFGRVFVLRREGTYRWHA